MQRATCTGLRIRSPADARVIFHAVLLDILPIVTRRLDTEERALITPGSVYVWEERGPHAELTGVGIERWTDGIRWGPSRVREGFLFYHEKQDNHFPYSDGMNVMSSSVRDTRSTLIKQTYTVFVDTLRGQRKWHLIAYFTEESLNTLKSIDDLPHLASLPVPHGKYKSARSAKGRPDHIFNPDQEGEFPRIEYIQYKPKSSPASDHSPSVSPPERSPASTTLRKWMNANHSSVTPSGRVIPTGLYTQSTGRRRSNSSEQTSSENLAPLAYLQTVPPPRRYPEDEKTLMLLATRRL